MPADALIRPAADSPDAAGLRDVVTLAWPAAAHAALAAVGFAFDRVWVARLEPASLASLHVSSTLAWTLLATLGGIAVGALALVGRSFGRAHPGEVRAVTEMALLSSLIASGAVALVLTFAQAALVDGCFSELSVPVRAEALAYLGVALPCLPLPVMAVTAGACLQARGDTRTPMSAAAVARALQVLLGAALVLGVGGIDGLGVRGAAWATAGSFAIELSWLLTVLWRRDREAAPASARIRRQVLGALGRMSIPAVLDKGVHQLGFLAYAAVVARLGAEAMADNQGLLAIEALAFPLVEGLAVAAAVLVAQRQHRDAARGACGRPSPAAPWRLATPLAVATTLLFSLSWLVAPDRWLHLATAGQPGSQAKACLLIAAATQPFVAVAVVGASALRGAGRTREVAWMTLCCSLPVRLLLCWLFAIELDMGLAGAWLGCAADWLGQSLWVCVLHRRSRHGRF